VFVTHDQHEALSMSDRVAVLRAGRIEQVGSASEIYDRPRTHFVADFIGETNLLPARRAGDDTYRLSGSDVLLTAEPLDSAGEVFLAIRPERVVLGDAQTCPLRARVSNTVYGGADRVVELVLPGGLTLRARIDAKSEIASRLRQGDETGVALPKDALRVLPP
jgi:spermidine/putrescine transport system ATP-binding protein